MIRVAVIGLGMAVAPHARSLIELRGRVEVAAAYSPTADRRRAFAEAYGLPVTGDVEAIFADRTIDAVMVLTPPSTHLDLVRRAAAAGKHVLLEKPLEISLDRAQALVAAARDAGITLGVVLQHRFRPVAVALADLVRQGRLGAIVGASARLYNWRPQSYYDQPGRGTRARDGGGVLLTQGIHTLDLLVSLAGLPVAVTAQATTTPVHRMETEDLAVAVLRFGNGALGTVGATTCAYPGYPDAIDLIGTAGTARLDGTSLSARFHDGGEVTMDDGAAGGGAGADPMAFPHHHHRAVLADFLEAVASGGAPRAGGREALDVHRLIEAILRSAATGACEPV
ncbi:Gfo/Idh/MocA family oxidoreductase [Arenibaculum sp.]|jgi:predicted dehydrogenase|uniref:Gfo/Idh/MocA family protein n=1 Tax=Arenibaculum sp. TaxID=2865862 RepID=UPI002E133AC3|nr:Gfo/Idh/MocA family oxidoreductase [Arenibaculum sp.]